MFLSLSLSSLSIHLSIHDNYLFCIIYMLFSLVLFSFSSFSPLLLIILSTLSFTPCSHLAYSILYLLSINCFLISTLSFCSSCIC